MFRKVLKQLFSMGTAGILMVVLAVAMAVATFVENSSGTVSAKALIYNAWWFELLIGITFISILLNIFRFKLFNLKKLPVFIFHFAFLIIILGAAITRYISSEGTMHIREGESSNIFQSYDTFFYASVESGSGLSEAKQKVFLSPRSGKQVGTSLKTDDGRIRFSSTSFMSGRQMAAQMGGNTPQADVLTVRVKVKGQTEEILLRGSAQQPLRLAEYEINGTTIKAGFGTMASQLPFSIRLEDFQLERYPGSNSPSSFASEVILEDTERNINEPFRIFMNHILKHRGYRFYQSSYDQDEKGTVLSVNNDAIGTSVTYLGYFLMIVFILFSMLAPGSRFVKLVKDTRKPALTVLLALLMLGGGSLMAQGGQKAGQSVKQESKAFGKIWVQGIDGRFKPVNTLAQELTRKLFGENRYGNQSPEEFWLDLMVNSMEWEQRPVFDIENPQIANMLGTNKTKVSFAEFFRNNQYILSSAVNQAVSKKANEQSRLEKDLLKLDEKLNVFYLAYTGQMLKIFPIPEHPESKWVDVNVTGAGFPAQDSAFVANAFTYYLQSVANGSLAEAATIRDGIVKFQEKYSGSIMPTSRRADLEILYNKLLVFERLTIVYAMVGLLLLIIQFMAMFKRAKWQVASSKVLSALAVVAFVVHTIGLAIRWYVSGHAPMSNGYESMIFVAWGTLLAGMFLMKRSKMAVALTAVLAALSLLVAHLSWMSPEITPLVPVLKSPWLTIHVAVIMTSYSFLGLGALVGLVNLVLYLLKNRKNAGNLDEHIAFLTKLNKIVLTVGLYLITIGCFLGAIWANVSWGRYWGWDAKETWALISILVYSFVVHMHHMKGMEDDFSFNLASVFAFGSILMTYFGVNFFFTRSMHSYASGSTPGLPVGFYIALIILLALVYGAYFNQQKFIPKTTKKKA